MRVRTEKQGRVNLKWRLRSETILLLIKTTVPTNTSFWSIPTHLDTIGAQRDRRLDSYGKSPRIVNWHLTPPFLDQGESQSPVLLLLSPSFLSFSTFLIRLFPFVMSLPTATPLPRFFLPIWPLLSFSGYTQWLSPRLSAFYRSSFSKRKGVNKQKGGILTLFTTEVLSVISFLLWSCTLISF